MIGDVSEGGGEIGNRLIRENRLGILGWISDGYWVEDHERDLIRVQSLSLRTTKDQGSLTKREGQKREN